MPVSIKALAVVLVLAIAVFAVAKKPVCALAMTVADFSRRRNLWLGITVAAFLAQSFWIFVLAALILLIYGMRQEPNKLAMYFFLLFAVPAFTAEIDGIGDIQKIIELTYPRLLAMVVLFSALRSLPGLAERLPFGRLPSDILIFLHLLVNFVLSFSVASPTQALRYGVFYGFVDVFLPYYVASRSLRSLKDYRDTLSAFVTAVMVLAAIGIFEFGRHWLLYAVLESDLGIQNRFVVYLERGDGILRAQASTGGPIVLGYVIAVAMAMYFYVRRLIPQNTARNLGLLLLVGGIVSPVARGPWVGAALMLFVFVVTSPNPGKLFAQCVGLALAAVAALVAIKGAEGLDKIINLLPFVSHEEDVTAVYRQRLLQTGIELISRNPFFGTYNYILTPEMEALRQGQGIIDVVNTYLAIALGSGLVDLALFVGAFIVVIVGIAQAMRKLPRKVSEEYLLGRVLIGALLGIMLIIFTVSSVSVIPIIYWSMIGLSAGYVRLFAQGRISRRFENQAAWSPGDRSIPAGSR